MSQLPHFDKLQIAEAKLTKYLPDPVHPEGGSKARFLLLLGDIGCVMAVHQDSIGFTVEFVSLGGESIGGNARCD